MTYMTVCESGWVQQGVWGRRYACIW